MKKNRIFLAFILAAILIFTTACGSSTKNETQSPMVTEEMTEATYEESYAETEYETMADSQLSDEAAQYSAAAPEAKVAGDAEDDGAVAIEAPDTGGDSAPPTSTGGLDDATAANKPNRKLIIQKNMNMETKEFDKGVTLIDQLLVKYNGYIQDSQLSGTNYFDDVRTARYANFTIRVPAVGIDNFSKEMESNFHLVSSNQSTQDLTTQYFDMKSKMDSLVAQKERLESLMDKQGRLQDLLEIEREISSVDYEINNIFNSLKNIDSLVDYATLNVIIQEVFEDTPKKIEESTITFSERLERGLRETWVGFVAFIQGLVIGILTSWPLILTLIIIAAIALFVFKKTKPMREKKALEVSANRERYLTAQQQRKDQTPAVPQLDRPYPPQTPQNATPPIPAPPIPAPPIPAPPALKNKKDKGDK